jgi:hypothetical protein
MKTINLKTISDFMSEKEMKKIKGGLDENDNFADTPGEPGGGGGGLCGGSQSQATCRGGCAPKIVNGQYINQSCKSIPRYPESGYHCMCG